MDKQTLIAGFQPEAASNTQFAQQFFSLTDHQRNWQPAPEKWSINQCLEHITITNRGWLSEINRLIANGAKMSDNHGEYKRVGIGGYMIGTLVTTKPRKYKTRKKFNPPSLLDTETVKNDFMNFQKQWEEAMDKIKGFDIDRNKVRSPFLNIIKYRLGNTIELNNIHTRRHLNQAMNVMKTDGFPKA